MIMLLLLLSRRKELEIKIPERRGGKLWSRLSKERNPISVDFQTAVLVFGIVLGVVYLLFTESLYYLFSFGFIPLFMLVGSLVSGFVAGLAGLIARFIYNRKVGPLIRGIVAVFIMVVVLTLLIVLSWLLTPAYLR